MLDTKQWVELTNSSYVRGGVGGCVNKTETKFFEELEIIGKGGKELVIVCFFLLLNQFALVIVGGEEKTEAAAKD